MEGSTGSYASLRRLEAQLRSLSGGLWSPVRIGILVGLALLVLVIVAFCVGFAVLGLTLRRRA